MKKILFAISAALLIVAGCSRIDEGSIPAFKNVIKVSSDEGTRTEIVTDDDVTFRHVWVKDDTIALFDARTILKYEMVGEGGSTVADFSGDAPQKQDPPYYAFYPYSDNIDIYHDATNQSKFLYEFPAEIVCSEGSVMAGSNVMIGFTDGKSLQMKNACSYVRISVSSPFLSFLNRIEITARGGEYIAGPHLVGIDPSGTPFTEAFSDMLCSNKVIVKFSDTYILTANTSHIYVPLPAVDLSQGLSFVLHGDFGGEPTINLVSSTATLDRNTVLVMENYRLPSEEAKIGETVYETVGEAFAVANASDDDVTITLLRSCVAAEKLNILSSKGKGDVTLNLNGKSLTVTESCNIVVDNRHFTVTDLFSDDPQSQGTIISLVSGTTPSPLHIQNGSHLDWKGGNLLANSSRGIYLTSQATATLSGGTINTPDNIAVGLGTTGKSLEIEGDIYINSGENNTIYLWGGVLNMTGGKLHNTKYSCVYAANEGSVANVSGGYVSSGNIYPVSANKGKAYVTGGNFNRAIAVTYAKDASGGVYLNDLNEDSATNEEFPFKVVPKSGDIVAHGVQSSYEWDFATLESGAKNASRTSGNNTLTLLTDVTTDATLEISNRSYTATLDLNGKKITSSASPAIEVPKGSTLTILDGSEAGSGEFSTSGATALAVGGTVNFNGGAATGATSAVAVSGGKFTALKGYFYGGTADITGNGSIKLSSGFFKNKPEAAMIEEDNAAIAATENHNDKTYNWEIKRGYTVMKSGSAFNTAIKSLANGSTITSYTYQDAAVKKIVFKVEQDLTSITGGVDLSTLEDGSVIASYDAGVVTVSTNYPALRTAAVISYMFMDFRELTEVEGWDLVDTRDATAAVYFLCCSLKLEKINVSKMKTGNITNMNAMFLDAPSLTQDVFDFSNWDTRSVTSMNYMFDSVSVEKLDLSKFDTKDVTSMAAMFANCFNLKDLNISSFNTSNVTTFDNMFEDCQKLEELDLRHFNTAKVTDLRSFCNRCYSLKKIDLSSFNTRKVTRFSYMFNDCNELVTIVTGPDFSGDSATTMYDFCRQCYKLETINMSQFVTGNALTTCYRAFIDCRSLKEIDLSGMKTPNVTTFYYMFGRCSAIKKIDMRNATCKGVNPDGSNDNYSTNGLNYVFYQCTNLEYLDIRNFEYPGKASYQYLFDGCVNMKELRLDKFGDISKFRYVNDYNRSVGSDTANSLLGQNATVENPCVIYVDDALLIRLLMFNRNYNNAGTYMNYGYAIRSSCKAGKLVFKKAGFNNPWTFEAGFDFSVAPTVDQIIAPTE